jgi:hypothetical protein
MGERTSVLQTAQTPSIPASCYFHRRSDFSTATPVIDNHVVQATVGSCLAHNVCHEMEPFRDCPSVLVQFDLRDSETRAT